MESPKKYKSACAEQAEKGKAMKTAPQNYSADLLSLPSDQTGRIPPWSKQ